MHDLSDRELVERFLDQKHEPHNIEEAFRQLYRRHTPRVYALVLRLVAGRRSDAEDAVQEAWMRASRRVRDFEWRSAFSTWLSSIAIRCALEAMRRQPMVNNHTPLDAIGELSTRHTSSDLSLDLERAIAMLPDGYRAALVLHDVEGLSHAEIADVLGITEGTARSQLFHARRAMRARLASTGS